MPSASRDTGSTRTSVPSTRAVASQTTRRMVITLAFMNTSIPDILVARTVKTNTANMDMDMVTGTVTDTVKLIIMDENDEKLKMSKK